MASLTQAIRVFQSGALSNDEFFAQVDRVLASRQASSERLLEILTEEHTKYPLPPDVYAEVHRRIEHLEEAGEGEVADETRMKADARPVPRPVPADITGGPAADAAADVDRVKGVGDTLNGRFVLEECLGFGGMGTVYKAVDLRKLEASDRNPYIAIKVLNVQFRGHPKSFIALQREAKKAQTLAHPNIVTVYDFDRDGSMVYLTMEHLSGKPLNRILRAPGFSGMPLQEALPIIEGMASALAYAHRRGFVHCDFKPANVFLTERGEVKVIDFGIARVFQRPEEDTEATVFDPGTLGGLTPAYASPEILEHREPDPRDDVYALACISYELLTGRHPFECVSATQARNTGLKPQRPKKLGARQWRALRAALSFERATRTASVVRFLEEMKGERRGTAGAPLAMSSLAAAILIAVGVGYYFWQYEDRPAGPLPGAGRPSEEARIATAPAVPPLPSVSAQPAASAGPFGADDVPVLGGPDSGVPESETAAELPEAPELAGAAEPIPEPETVAGTQPVAEAGEGDEAGKAAKPAQIEKLAEAAKEAAGAEKMAEAAKPVDPGAKMPAESAEPKTRSEPAGIVEPAKDPDPPGGETAVATAEPQTAVPPVAALAPPAVAPPTPTVAPLTLESVFPVLAGVPCSALSASLEARELRVQGYVSERFGVTRLREQLAALPGATGLRADVEQVSDEKCRVLESLAPYWARSREGMPATVRLRGRKSELEEGEPLVVDIKTPGFQSYVNVDYYVLDGNVLHMVPSPRARANLAPPNYSATIGGFGSWVISEPFGTELIVLLLTPEPLFPELRPEFESGPEYLRAVEERLKGMAAKHGAERIAVDFMQITTRPRKAQDGRPR